MSMQNIYDVGYPVLIANAAVAFMLNVSVVFLVSDSILVAYLCLLFADRQDIFSCSHTLWCFERYFVGRCQYDDLGHTCLSNPIFRLWNRTLRSHVLQIGSGSNQTIYGSRQPQLARIWSKQARCTQGCHLWSCFVYDVRSFGRSCSNIRTTANRKASRIHGIQCWWCY